VAQVAWATPLSDTLLALSVLASVGVIALSFVTWMDIVITEQLPNDTVVVVLHLDGTEADALTSFGDGYLTAACGALAAIFAAACRLARQWAFYPAAGMGAAGLLAAGIALYNIAYSRVADSGGTFGIAVQADVSRTVALWALLVLALVIVAVAASISAVIWRRVTPTIRGPADDVHAFEGDD
jgi:hypothetical protein